MNPPQSFSGFPQGKPKLTPIPNVFFSELLPAIDHLGELKITLYAFWALARKEGRFQYLRVEEMLDDPLLLNSLQAPGLSKEEALQESLERAVARGTLLRAQVTFASGPEDYFFLNSAKGQAGIAALESGEWQPSGDPQKPLELKIDRPNVFNLYEQNIGPLTPMIAELLRDAEANFPEQWIKEAIQIAVENNVRKWSYVRAILEGWKTEGKDDREDRGDTEKARRKYLKGWFDE
jgi:DnaD/phage-associated family protein